ncbi:MAG TPA: hypothetical protein DD435_03530 [Cyanobacteria bacterium UBA8530]|nr:hypothetical protein [Cyanobacteria bacterium UBA8530]
MSLKESHNHILIADSSPFFLRNITMLLQREGYEVSIAKDGRELLSLAIVRMPDLIMVDTALPDTTGKAICQVLRRNASTENIPTILTINDGDNVTEKDPALSGIQFLSKPLQTNTLVLTLMQMLYPSPQINQEITLLSGDRSVSWKTFVLRQIGQQRLLLQQDEWPAELAMAFQNGRKCALEYVAQDRARIEYAASIGNDLKEGLELRLDGPVKRTQQRQFFRKAVQVNVRYRFPGEFYRVTHTLDLSGGGAKLAEVPCNLGIGSEFEMILLLPEKKFTLNARIQWQRPLCHEKQEVGVIFTEIAPSEQEEIVMFLFGGLGQISPA